MCYAVLKERKQVFSSLAPILHTWVSKEKAEIHCTACTHHVKSVHFPGGFVSDAPSTDHHLLPVQVTLHHSMGVRLPLHCIERPGNQSGKNKQTKLLITQTFTKDIHPQTYTINIHNKPTSIIIHNLLQEYSQ